MGLLGDSQMVTVRQDVHLAIGAARGAARRDRSGYSHAHRVNTEPRTGEFPLVRVCAVRSTLTANGCLRAPDLVREILR